MKLLCPKCETWYSGRHFKAGELCGDRTVTKPGPCPGLLVDLALAVEAMNVAAETGRTPAQLAAERAELVGALEGAEMILAKLDTIRHLDKSFGGLDQLRAILAKVKGPVQS